jgi:hypothetical protein
MRQHSGAGLLEVRRRPGEATENSWEFRPSRWLKGGNEDLRAHCLPEDMADNKAKPDTSLSEMKGTFARRRFLPLKQRPTSLR